MPLHSLARVRKRLSSRPERLLHLVAEEYVPGLPWNSARALRRARHNRLPVEEGRGTDAPNPPSPHGRALCAPPLTHVIGDADPRDQLAGAVEAPLRAVRVDQVGQRLEPEPLVPGWRP